jgi:hypothetical protein
LCDGGAPSLFDYPSSADALTADARDNPMSGPGNPLSALSLAVPSAAHRPHRERGSFHQGGTIPTWQHQQETMSGHSAAMHGKQVTARDSERHSRGRPSGVHIISQYHHNIQP